MTKRKINYGYICPKCEDVRYTKPCKVCKKMEYL